MLKTMRKNVKSLKPVLWIVVFTFVIAIFAIWGGGGRVGERGSANVIATVGSQKIQADEYYQSLRQRIEAIKRQYSEINSALIQQLNIPMDTLAQIIQRRLLLQIAREMGLRASKNEVRDKIVSFAAFQKDGVFVGYELYRQILDYNHISIKEFEDGLREDALIDKLIGIVTSGIFITEDQVWENYQKENETARIEYLVLENSKVEVKDPPTEDQIRAHFEKNASAFKIPEKRTGDYVFLKTEDVKKDVKVEDSEIEDYYQENRAQFEEPEKTKVSRIWLPFTPETKEAVSSEAAGLASRIEAGEDFAGLAMAHSKDDKAVSGGDWGYYDWRSLSPAETEAVGNLEEGKSAGPVETESGFAILKVTEKTPAALRPLEDVRDTILRIIEDEKSRNLVSEAIQKLGKAARREKNLDLAAQKQNLKASSTGPLKKGDPLLDFDSAGSFSESLFALDVKEISAPVYTAAGAGLVQLNEIEPERPAQFEEVKAEIETDLMNVRKKETAFENLKAVKVSLKNDWASEATARNLEYRTVETHKWGQYLSLIGENPEIDKLIFTLPVGTVSELSPAESGWALFRVLDRKSADKQEFDKNKAAETDSFLAREKNVFLQSYLAQAREDKKVEVNYDLFLQLNSEILSRYAGE